jgi:hypothetical protein
MACYRRVKIPEEIIERPTTGLEGATGEAEYLVEPEHSKEGAGVQSQRSVHVLPARARDPNPF